MGKFWQSVSAKIEAKLQGRATLLIVVLIVLAFLFYIAMRDYPRHPVLSAGLSIGLLAVFVLFVLFVFFARPRSAEENPISLYVDRLGVVFASGVPSQTDLAGLIRTISNIEPLPPPSGLINGKASADPQYSPLTNEQAQAILTRDEEEIRALLDREAKQLDLDLRQALSSATQGRIGGGRIRQLKAAAGNKSRRP
jgi:hypothetical protein